MSCTVAKCGIKWNLTFIIERYKFCSFIVILSEGRSGGGVTNELEEYLIKYLGGVMKGASVRRAVCSKPFRSLRSLNDIIIKNLMT